jgi:hypothetical protein
VPPRPRAQGSLSSSRSPSAAWRGRGAGDRRRRGRGHEGGARRLETGVGDGGRFDLQTREWSQGGVSHGRQGRQFRCRLEDAGLDEALSERALRLLMVIQEQDQVVACPRCRHVEETVALRRLVRFLLRLDVVHGAEFEVRAARARANRNRDGAGPAVESQDVVLVAAPNAEAGQEDDGELQPLGGVDGEHAHRILVIVEASAFVVEDRPTSAALQPLNESAQALGALGLEGPCLLDDEAGATEGVPVAGVVHARLHEAALADEALDEPGQGTRATLVAPAQVLQGFGHAPGEAVDGGRKVVEGAAVQPVRGDLDVGAGVGWAA